MDTSTSNWGCNDKGIKRIKTLQKRAVRTVANKSRSAHADPVFGNLEILKFDDLFQLNSCIFMHKYMNNNLPESFSNMVKPLSEPDWTKNFLLEKTKRKYLDWFPKVILPKFWNSFKLELKMQNLQFQSSANLRRTFMNIKASDA